VSYVVERHYTVSFSTGGSTVSSGHSEVQRSVFVR
jgi:hypothetical protein